MVASSRGRKDTAPRAVDGRMEGIDEMWMPCEYRRPYKVPVLREPYSMYGGWSRTEQGAADRDTLYAACPRALVRCFVGHTQQVLLGTALSDITGLTRHYADERDAAGP